MYAADVVCWLLSFGLAGLSGLILLANSLMVQQQAPCAPPRAVPDPHAFLPERTQGQGPSTCLLHLGLLAAIAASNATPTLSLQSKRALKKDLQKYWGSSGFITQTAAI
jgi:hypothetical protein